MRCRGIALITVLAVTMLTGLCALSAFQQIHSAMGSVNDELFSSAAKTKAATAALEKLREAEDVAGKSVSCRESEGSKGGVRITTTICSIVYPANFSKLRENVLEGPDGFPGIDFNSLFSGVNDTGCGRYSWKGGMPSGFPLTTGSAVSGLLCMLDSDVTLKDLRIRGNTAANSPIKASNTDAEAAYALLAATGFIDIAAPVVSDRDLLIVAGGDLHVGAILTTKPDFVKVTLISSTGTVRVDEVGNLVSLKAFGREGVRIPSSYKPPFQHLLLPKVLKISALCMR